MKAYDIEMLTRSADPARDHGWCFGLPPGISPQQWPLDPANGYPLMHGFTLLLPEDYRVHGPEIVALSFFATAPEGQIYRMRPGAAPAAGNAQQAGGASPAVDIFFSPKTKYIWALALDRAGNLYAATGDNGEIYKIDPQGHGAVFFKTDDPHIRSMAFDAQGNLIAGSDGSGLVYRISPSGEGSRSSDMASGSRCRPTSCDRLRWTGRPCSPMNTGLASRSPAPLRTSME